MHHNSRPGVISSTLVLTVGVAVIRVVASVVAGRFLANQFRSRSGPSERVHCTLDGQVGIASYASGDQGKRTYRSLDGKELDLADEDDLSLTHLKQRPAVPALLPDPIPWRARLNGTTDFGNPANHWFLIRDASRQGRAYFVCYDSVTKLPLGYLDRAGYHPSLPQPKDLFNMQGHRVGGWSRYLASNGYFQPPERYTTYLYFRNSPDVSPKSWIVFFLDKGRIWQIDLRERTIAVFHETDDALSIRMTSEPILTRKSESGTDGEADEPVESRRNMVSRLAIRCADRIEIWNPTTHEKRAFPLPERLRRKDYLEILSLPADGHLLVSVNQGYWKRGSRQELIWLDEKGTEVRSQVLELLGPVPTSGRANAWALAGAAPIPVVWGLTEFVVTPWKKVNDHAEATYQSALRRQWLDAWPAAVTLLAVSAVLAWLTVRQHRSQFGSFAWWTGGFVLLTGLPGMIAWWLLNPRPHLSPCPHCSRDVPRHRESCAGCGEPFPEPDPKGTEVFA